MPVSLVEIAQNDVGTSPQSDTPLTQPRSLAVRASPKTGYVYFIKVGAAIKIGYSTRPIKRLQALQTSNPGTLEILGTRWCSRDLEKELHEYFKRWHIRGEWFKAAKPIIRYIEDGTPEGIAAAKKRRADSLNAMGPARVKRRIDPAATAKLIALRNRYDAKSPAGFRCSNLIEGLGNLADYVRPSWAIHASQTLHADMKIQAADLARLIAA